MDDDEEIMWVCPQCGAVKSGFADDKCNVCKCSIINTGVTWDEYVAYGEEKWDEWKKEASWKFAPNATVEAKQKRAEHDNRTPTFIPKCPTCGQYARRLSTTESSIPLALEFGFNSNKAGKTFICEHCGYTW